MKTYITFGQIHTHGINGKTFDHNCIGVIEHPESESGHEIAMDIFDAKFHNAYPEDEWNSMKDPLKYYPRGLIGVNCDVGT